MKSRAANTDDYVDAIRNAEVMAFFSDEPYLSRLTFKFSRAGIDTVGRVIDKGENDLRKDFDIRGRNIERIRSKLAYFGLKLAD